MLTRLVLAIEDAGLQNVLEESFASADVQVESCGQEKNPWQRVVQSCGDIIVVSESLIPQPVESSLTVLNNLPETPTTVVLHGFDSSEEHAQLMAAGADVVLYSGIMKTSLVDAIQTTLDYRQQLGPVEALERWNKVQPKLTDFISNSEEMQIFINEVKLVASSDSILLLLGETGVGKEHLAKAIHAESPRASAPFVALNMAALPEQLLESELFGHTRGAFTGATRYRRGAFELAHGGTIFLDEIGEMPLHLQTKLLRVLQDYEIRPVGSEKPVWVDVRVIAATNRDLEVEVAEGNFRKDLYYRLSVMTLTIPPLRHRQEDIPAMVRRFMTYYRYKIGRDVSQISDQALKALRRYDWPGNVRELMNVIERAMLICKAHEISIQDLPSGFHQGLLPTRYQFLPGPDAYPASWKEKTLPEVQREVLDQVEAIYIQMILNETGGRVNQAAEKAGINSRSLYNKMKRLGIRKSDFRKPGRGEVRGKG
ncbi:MAG: sigma-54 dependent transcriptional regulator [Proteobacteria bacterium]|nr:sigma-54 dependent transcriptional regulator [Pseudomonadota bacterium]MBU1686085.1 sigma-54 dependent transcriptional regulator [Pseudomonadota bacterium]